MASLGHTAGFNFAHMKINSKTRVCFSQQKAKGLNAACALVVSLLRSVGEGAVCQINLKSMAGVAWCIRACAQCFSQKPRFMNNL